MMHRPISSVVLSAALLCMLAGHALGADADGSSPCPPLGPRDGAIAFFTDRGFPGAEPVGADPSPMGAVDDGTTWVSTLGPMTATVTGDRLATSIELHGIFLTDLPEDDDAPWEPWSQEDLTDSMLWSTQLIDEFAGQAPRPDGTSPLVDLADTSLKVFPGGLVHDAGDRTASLRVWSTDQAIHVDGVVTVIDPPAFQCE